MSVVVSPVVVSVVVTSAVVSAVGASRVGFPSLQLTPAVISSPSSTCRRLQSLHSHLSNIADIHGSADMGCLDQCWDHCSAGLDEETPDVVTQACRHQCHRFGPRSRSLVVSHWVIVLP